jgi:hypothetical protein
MHPPALPGILTTGWGRDTSHDRGSRPSLREVGKRRHKRRVGTSHAFVTLAKAGAQCGYPPTRE